MENNEVSKPWWQSKTLWLNALAAVLTALEASTGALQPFLPVNYYAAMALALPVANALLRVVTTRSLNFGAPGGS